MRIPLTRPVSHCFFCMVKRHASRSISNVMRAVQIHRFGGLEEVILSDTCRRPSVGGPDEILVRVRAASLNPMDVAMISGYGRRAFAPIRRYLESNAEFPFILGRDFSGEVIATGCHVKAPELRPGKEVIGAIWPFRNGSLCDYVSISADQVAPKPTMWDHATGAALPYAGLTAYSAIVETGGLRKERARDMSVLVIGATGGVGSIAVQLCTAWGAHVVATAHSDAEDMVLNFGANCVINADQEGGTEKLLQDVLEVSRSGAGYDIILDGVGLKGMNKALKQGRLARYVTLRGDLLRMTDRFGPVVGTAAAGLQLLRRNAKEIAENQRLSTWGFFRSSGRNLRQLTKLGENGLLKPVIDEILPLSDVKCGFEKVQSGGLRGKVVVQM